MKKLLLVTVLFIAACTSNNENVSTQNNDDKTNDLVSEQEVSLSNLVALSSDLVLSGDATDPILLNATKSTDVSKNIKITNPTSEIKALDLRIVGNSLMKLTINRCAATLAPKQSCSLQLSHNIRKVENGTHSGFLQIMAPDIGVGISSTVSTSLYVPKTTGGSVLTDLTVNLQKFDNYVPGTRVTTEALLTNSSPSKSIEISSFNLPADYKIILNRCGEVLPPHTTCKVYLYLSSDSEPGPADSFGVNSGSETKAVELVTAPVYIATYSGYSPAPPTLAACGGTVTSTRIITECRQQNNNALVSNSQCGGDITPSIVTASPAGEVDEAIVTTPGTRKFSCAEGSSTKTFVSGTCPSGTYTGGPTGTCTPPVALTISSEIGVKSYYNKNGWHETGMNSSIIDMLQELKTYEHGVSKQDVPFTAAGGWGGYVYSIVGGNSSRASINASTGVLSVYWGSADVMITVQVTSAGFTASKIVTLRGGFPTSCAQANARVQVATDSWWPETGSYLIDPDGNPANGISITYCVF